MLKELAIAIVRSPLWLKPPELTDNGEIEDNAHRTQMHPYRLNRWRWRMYWTVLALVLLGAVDQALSWGALPKLGVDVGFRGYAWTSDVEKTVDTAVRPIKDDIAKIKAAVEAQAAKDKEREIEDLKQQIFETRVAQCRARAGETGANPYTRRLGDLADKYRELTGREYPLPACEDL